MQPNFDPRTLGAVCDSCPLNGKAIPVPPQVNSNPRLIILGEAPGKTEETEQKPFVGASGWILEQGCRTLKAKRSQFHISNALLCRPPHKGFKPADWKSALAACRPRLERELANIAADVPVFAVGAKALQALTGKAKIVPWMGAPLPSELGRDVLPALHPAAALRSPPLLPVFRMLFGRALKLADGRLPSWQWPEIEINPGSRQVQLLAQMLEEQLPIGIDVETAGLDPMRDTLLCVGIANEHAAVSIPYPILDPQIAICLQALLEDKRITKVLHNASHDLLTLKYNGFTVRGDIFDTLLAHATAGPQLPHDLGFVAMTEFHAPRWKSEFRVESDAKGSEVFTKRDAGDLRLYNAKDAYITALLKKPLEVRLAQVYNGRALFAEYTELAELAMRMREHGMKVDKSKLSEHREKLTKIMDAAATKFREVVVDESFKLGKAGQHDSLKRLFFQTLGFRPTRYTDEGEPQLDAQTLEDIVASGHVSAGPIARVVRDYRKAAKLRSTYVDGLPLTPEGDLHPVWAPHRAVTGRWGCGSPNMMNVPAQMRDLIVPG